MLMLTQPFRVTFNTAYTNICITKYMICHVHFIDDLCMSPNLIVQINSNVDSLVVDWINLTLGHRSGMQKSFIFPNTNIKLSEVYASFN